MHSTVVQNQANHKGLLIPSLLTLEACYAPLLGKEDRGRPSGSGGIAIGEQGQGHRGAGARPSESRSKAIGE